jgi:hypothetical protein
MKKRFILKSGKYKLIKIIPKFNILSLLKKVKINDHIFRIVSMISEGFEELEYPKWESDTEVQINEYITLRLVKGETQIYINGKIFRQCKYLLLDLPDKCIVEEIDSIDEAQQYFSSEHESHKDLFSKETEFWGHASNIQAFVENDYDTRILHSNLAFPLLKALAEEGDPLAIMKLKEEVLLRVQSGYENVIIFILEGDYIIDWSEEELEVLSETPNLSFEAVFLIYKKYRNPEIEERLKILITESFREGDFGILKRTYHYLPELYHKGELEEVSGDIKNIITIAFKTSDKEELEEVIHLIPFIFEYGEVEDLIELSDFSILVFLHLKGGSLYGKLISLIETRMKELILRAFEESDQETIREIPPHLFLSIFDEMEFEALIKTPNLSFYELLLLSKYYDSPEMKIRLISSINRENLYSDVEIFGYSEFYEVIKMWKVIKNLEDHFNLNLMSHNDTAFLQIYSSDRISLIEVVLNDVHINHSSVVSIPLEALPSPYSINTPSIEIMILEYQILFIERSESEVINIHQIYQRESYMTEMEIPNKNLDNATKNLSSFTISKKQIETIIRRIPKFSTIRFSRDGVSFKGGKERKVEDELVYIPLDELESWNFNKDFKEFETFTFVSRDLSFLRILNNEDHIKFFIRFENPIRIQFSFFQMDIDIFVAPIIDPLTDFG